MSMVIHDRELDTKGVGKWDFATGRYIPLSGGSRSRLPIWDDKEYPRYNGYVGVDEHLSESLFTMAALYTYLGGAPAVIEGHGSVFVGLIHQAALDRMRAADEDAQK
jgi:hypothetical protein